MPTTSCVFGGVPSFFAAACRDVRHQLVKASYEHPARELTRHLEAKVPDDAGDDQWYEQLADLGRRVAERDAAGIIAWFVEHYPRCMALVPTRRRHQFLKGVYAGAEDLPAG